MPKKPKERMTVVCSKCGKEPEKDKEKSNSNWTIIDVKACRFCGEQITFKLIKD